MEKQPLVTIGLPFYNCGNYLRYSIISVINQTYQNWELLLINDGSTDNYREVIDSFHDERIRIIDDGKNLGLPARLNQLTHLANGVYYARMDADDIMRLDRITKQVDYMLNNPEVDVVGTMAYGIDADNNIMGLSRHLEEAPHCVEDILKGNRFLHPSILGKTSWFMKNPYDTKLRRMQDLALWIKTVEKSNFSYISEPLLSYRADGIPSLSKYLSTQKYSRYFYKTITGYINSAQRIKMYLLTYVKSMIYITLSLFKKESILINRTSQSLDKNEREKAIELLNKSISLYA